MQEDRQPAVYSWGQSIGLAVACAVGAVALIVLFTYLVDWVGQFWSQVI